MEYRISGAKKDDGQPVTIVIEASSQTEAEAKANKRGILVESCQPAIATHSAAASSGRSQASSREASGPNQLAQVVIAVWLLGVTGISAASFLQTRSLAAQLAEVQRRSAEYEQKLPERVDQRMVEFAQRAQASLDRTSREALSAKPVGPRSKDEAIAADSGLAALAKRYPEFRVALKYGTAADVGRFTGMWVSNGDMTAAEAERIRGLASQVRDLP